MNTINDTYEVRCVRCKTPHYLKCDPESMALFKEGKLLIQDCFIELTDAEREMLITGICPTCWIEMFHHDDEAEDLEPFGAKHDALTDEQLEWLDENHEFDNSYKPEGRTPLSFWKAIRVCWKARKQTTAKLEQRAYKEVVNCDPFDGEDLKTEWNTGYWLKLTLRTTQFPVNYGRVETVFHFCPLSTNEKNRACLRPLGWWLRCDSEHIASLMGDEVIDGPGPGYGSTYHYQGWLGHHDAI